MRFERRGSFGGRRFGGGGRRFGGGFRERRSFSDEPKPVNVGEEYDVEITETGSRGDGIARVKNFVVFVDGAKQGEKVRIKITDVRGRFALGQKVGAAKEGATTEPESATDVTEAEIEKVEGDDEGESGDEYSGEELSDESSDEESSEETKE